MELIDRTYAEDEGRRLVYQVPMKCVVHYNPEKANDVTSFCNNVFLNPEVEIIEDRDDGDGVVRVSAIYGDLQISVGEYQDEDQVLENEIYDLNSSFSEFCYFIESIEEN